MLGASVLGRICERRETPLLGALALALSPNAITLSGVAESYMLCTAFLLAATRAYLGLIAPAPAGRGRAAAGFALFASLALLSHYAAGLFLLAAAAAPLVVAALEPDYRHAWKEERASRFAAPAAAFLAPLVVAGLLYRLLARPWLHRLSHVEEFYFSPGRETIPAFLGRALAATFDLFAPFRVGAPLAAAGALLVFLALVTAIAVRADRRRGGAGPPSATPAVLLVLLVVVESAAGVAGRYPFGGGMRHQFLLLLFAILAGAAALDGILARLPRGAGRALVGVALLAIVANWLGHLDGRWRPRPEPFSAERARFDTDFPDASEIHVDQFNLVAFFAQHHDWDWEFLGSVGGRPSVQRYRVSRDGRTLDLVAHRDVWNFDPGSPDTYHAVAESAASPASTAPALFDIRPPTDPAIDAEALRETIPALARGAGLRTRRLDVEGATVFAEFWRDGIAPAR